LVIAETYNKELGFHRTHLHNRNHRHTSTLCWHTDHWNIQTHTLNYRHSLHTHIHTLTRYSTNCC